MELNTCAICGTPIETKVTCYDCGKVVCSQHYKMKMGTYKCSRCVEKWEKTYGKWDGA